jgi:hypothetical protein
MAPDHSSAFTGDAVFPKFMRTVTRQIFERQLAASDR